MSKIRRTVSYLKRNGIANTITAVLERIDKKGMDQAGRQAASYMRQVTPKERWEMDAFSDAENRTWKKAYTFSILVPTYETDETYLREMIDSVLGQSYKKLQLVLADASASDRVERVAKTYRDDRLTYFRLQENAGISHNTNEALAHATGEYIGLLDHDDLLCKDALAYMMQRLEEQDYLFLYTDEDKIDQTGTTVFEPNWKPDFNLDYLLSNNYICHFSVIRADLMKKLQFRSSYDGAQDYDLFLRTVYEIGKEGPKDTEGRLLYPQAYMDRKIAHIPQICYHWRAHLGSTADNPQSKLYAYEAGKRALEDFARQNGWQAEICHTNHLGFYRIGWKDIFAQRPDVVAVCSNECRRGRVAESGTLQGAKYGEHVFAGLKKRYSGYLHRASMTVDVTDPPLQQTVYRKDAEQKQGRIVYLPGSKQ